MFLNNQAKSSRGKRDGDRGQSSVEFVAIFPLLLIMFFLMLDFGWMLKNWIVVTNSAREATRCAAANSCVDSTGAPIPPQDLACNRLKAGLAGESGSAGALSNRVIRIYYDPDPSAPVSGDAIIITIFTTNKSLFLGGSFLGVNFPNINLTAQETMRLEVAQPTGAPAGDYSCT